MASPTPSPHGQTSGPSDAVAHLPSTESAIGNRLKQWRVVATRYDKRAGNYRAGVVIAALLLWLEP